MLYALLFIVTFVLIAIAAVRIPRLDTSRYELERRAKDGDDNAKEMLHRDSLVPDLISLQRAGVALSIIGVVLVSVAAFGIFLGTMIALVISLGYGVVSRRPMTNSLVQKWYLNLEPTLVSWTEKVPIVFSFLRTVTVDVTGDPEIRSKEQLLHLVEQSHDVFSKEEKLHIKHGLVFGSKRVADCMTPRSVIDSVAAPELLGPLVLDDLHKTGHSRFPVIEGDIDHVVGILHVRNLLTLDAAKRTTTAEKAMESRVFYINETQTLEHALAAFIRTHHHLFIVVNEYRETVGILSLEDVVETLLGREIVDEFDTHEDLRIVAARNPRANNDPKLHTDV